MSAIRHGPWTISRSEWSPEWEATHDDYDASWEGEEDGWVGNGLHTSAATIAELLEEIEEIERERGFPITPRDIK